MGILYDDSDVLMHYGIKRRSGRYPWGSGDTPFQSSGDFLSRVQDLKNEGFSETEIVKALGLDSTTQLRISYTVAKNDRRKLKVATVKSLMEDGLNTSEIARKMGINESTVRSLMDTKSEERMNQADQVYKKLAEELASKDVLDIGAGVERNLGVSRQKLEEAVYRMEADGLGIRDGVSVKTGPKTQTNITIFRKPDIEVKDIYNDLSMVKPVGEFHSIDGGKTFKKREYPQSIDSKRIKIVYAEDGGTEKDGVIEIRRGVDDLNLGQSHYAQVRILVDGTHYLKGMAMYSDDMPEGVDIKFNTNKSSDTPKMKVLKEIQPDPDNPFGAYIKADGQSHYIGKDGKEHLSAINKLKEEGDWDTMSRNLSSQFLSKQPMKLINQQLDLTYKEKRKELDEIMALTNPTVKKKLLLEYADECDSAAIHLKAVAFPRQQTRVILPLTQLKDNEVYAPYLNDGERVALVRYPHGGTFEIPELVVNNKNKSAKSILGNAIDAIGINANVAKQLSGADYDGDTVVVIPYSDKVKISTKKYYSELADFEPKDTYSTEGKTGVKLMSKSMVQREMGMISNLITDMTLQGANDSDIVKAVKHSMVVIDAYKHKLDYKQSEIDNDIATLKMRYQPKYDEEGNVIGGGGASTLLSKRKQTLKVPEQRGSGVIDPETGKVTYKETGRIYYDAKKKQWVEAKTDISKILYYDDVNELSSGTKQETAYANYANSVKALAAEARKAYATTPNLEYSSSANKTYATEVKSLLSQLAIAEMNAPRERQAQVLANSVVKAKIQSNPELEDRENKKLLNKIKSAALYDARLSVGASGKETRITISNKEWEAIQAGAISNNQLTKILRFADPDKVRSLAMPKAATALLPAQIAKIQSLGASGKYTIAQIAEALGISTSTVSEYINK